MDAPSNSIPQGRYRAIVDQAAGGFVLSDLAGRFVLVNARWCAMLGYSCDEMLQLSLCDLVFPESADEDRNLATLLKDRATVEVEKRYRRKDGSGVWLSMSVSTVCDDAGHPEAIVSLATDITKRKAAAALNTFLVDLRLPPSSTENAMRTTTARALSDPPRWRRPRSPWPCR